MIMAYSQRHSTKQGLDLWTRGPVDSWTRGLEIRIHISIIFSMPRVSLIMCSKTQQ